MANTTQDNRLIRVTTPLGKDALLAVGFYGREAISEPFRFSLDCRSDRAKPAALDQLIGQSFTVDIDLPNKKTRSMNAICWRAEQGESDASFTNYRFELVPKFWLLSKKTRSRTYQQMSIPDILKKVFDEGGLETSFKLQGKYEKREYVVQYRESDFSFCSRLMEEEGIFYFFDHASGKHTMILGDTKTVFPNVPVGPSQITYKNSHGDTQEENDTITQMAKAQQFATAKFTNWDHTFELPHKNQEKKNDLEPGNISVGKVSHNLKAPVVVEQYDWPGGHPKRFDKIDKGGGEQDAELGKIDPEGTRLIKVRAEREAAAAVAVFGSSQCRHFCSGHAFSVATLPTDLVTGPIKADGEYVLTEVTHHARIADNMRSGSGMGESATYTNSFVAMPKGLTFRPARSTPRPVVPGCQSAQVVGPSGEEIFTDKFGRVKVQFHWDREGVRDAGSSCWLRVVVGSAGRNWGMQAIPRVGQEVIVDFLEGDPDRPIVVGVVPNPDQMPIYTLPDNRTRSYWRSNSSKGGDGYNEIRYEDLAGSEQIYVHAQRNYDERVRNDRMEFVGKDRHMRVGFYQDKEHQGNLAEEKKGNQFEEVAIDKHEKVHRHKIEHIGGDYQLLIGGGDGDGNLDVHIKKDKKQLIDGNVDEHIKGYSALLVDGTLDEHVKGAVKQTYDATYDFHVKGKHTEKIGGDANLDVTGKMLQKSGGNLHQTIGGSLAQKVTQNAALDAGQQIHLKAGMDAVIEAGVSLTLKVGGNFVNINSGGVFIQGTMVMINSGGAAGSGSGASPDSPASAQDAKDAKDAKDANPTKPTEADHHTTGKKSN